MSVRTDNDFIKDIQESVCRIRRYTDSMTYADFMEDTRTQDAVIRNLEIIGLAT